MINKIILLQSDMYGNSLAQVNLEAFIFWAAHDYCIMSGAVELLTDHNAVSNYRGV